MDVSIFTPTPAFANDMADVLRVFLGNIGVLVNTARGALIDSDALIDAVEQKKVGAAALDVVEKEFGLYYYDHKNDILTNRQLSLLRSFPNVILSPHNAFYTDVNVASMVESVFAAVDGFAKGKENPDEVRL